VLWNFQVIVCAREICGIASAAPAAAAAPAAFKNPRRLLRAGLSSFLVIVFLPDCIVGRGRSD
jgi:hypothetical protein